MTKELAKEIIEILKSTKSFAAEQMPDVVAQKLLIGLYSNIMGIIFFSGVLIFLIICFIKHFSDEQEIHPFLSCVIIIDAFIIFLDIYTIFKIKLAPKVYILGWLKEFIN